MLPRLCYAATSHNSRTHSKLLATPSIPTPRQSQLLKLNKVKELYDEHHHEKPEKFIDDHPEGMSTAREVSTFAVGKTQRTFVLLFSRDSCCDDNGHWSPREILEFKRNWLTGIWDGIKQHNPKLTRRCLFDMLGKGRFAEAALNGFLKARKYRTCNILDYLENGEIGKSYNPRRR